MKGTKMMLKQVLQNPPDKTMSGVKCLAAIVDSSDFKCKLKWLLNYAAHEPMMCHFGDSRQSAVHLGHHCYYMLCLGNIYTNTHTNTSTYISKERERIKSPKYYKQTGLSWSRCSWLIEKAVKVEWGIQVSFFLKLSES